MLDTMDKPQFVTLVYWHKFMSVLLSRQLVGCQRCFDWETEAQLEKQVKNLFLKIQQIMCIFYLNGYRVFGDAENTVKTAVIVLSFRETDDYLCDPNGH